MMIASEKPRKPRHLDRFWARRTVGGVNSVQPAASSAFDRVSNQWTEHRNAGESSSTSGADLIGNRWPEGQGEVQLKRGHHVGLPGRKTYRGTPFPGGGSPVEHRICSKGPAGRSDSGHVASRGVGRSRAAGKSKNTPSVPLKTVKFPNRGHLNKGRTHTASRGKKTSRKGRHCAAIWMVGRQNALGHSRKAPPVRCSAVNITSKSTVHAGGCYRPGRNHGKARTLPGRMGNVTEGRTTC